MFCPSCGQQQLAEDTRFCSRCGFLLTGVSELISTNGVLPQIPFKYDPTKISPRRRGVKQGGSLLLLSLFIIPIFAMFIQATRGPVELVMILGLITFWGGILRMLYALLFESKFPTLAADESLLPKVVQNFLPAGKKSDALPPQQTTPAEFYTSPTRVNWRTTNDLVAPSVIDHTTKLLERED